MNRLALDAIVSQYEIKEDNGQKIALGKNLFDEIVQLGHYSDITGELKTTVSAISSKNPIIVQSQQGYYNCSTTTLYAHFFDENHNWIPPQLTWGTKSRITAPKNAKFLYFNINSSYGIFYNNNIAICQENIKYQAYEGGYAPPVIKNGARCEIPELKVLGKGYQEQLPNLDQPIEPVFSENIKITSYGKNLLNMDGIVYYGGYNKGIPVVRDVNSPIYNFPQTVTSSGSNGICLVIPCFKGVTYTLSLSNPDDELKRVGIAIYKTFDDIMDATKAIISGSDQWGETYKPVTITSPIDGYMVCCLAVKWHSGGVTVTTTFNKTDQIMLEVGDTATEYEPYKEYSSIISPQLLGLKEGYEDVWNVTNGTIKRRIKKFRLPANISYVYAVNDNPEWCSIWTSNGSLGQSEMNIDNRIEPLYCNYLPYVTDNDYYRKRARLGFMGYADQSAALMFTLPTSKFPDSTAWKQFLEENEVYVYYAMNTVIEEQVEPQYLIQGPGTTTLVQTNGNIPACQIKTKYVTHK